MNLSKQILPLFIVAFLFSSQLLAQEDQFNSKPTSDKKKIYLGISTGIDNITGILGPVFEYNPTRNFTAYGAAGLGSWGYKISGGVKYYIKYPYKWAFNLGVSHATGINELETELEVFSASGTTTAPVLVEFKPSSTLNLSALYNLKVGQKNRFSFELGYAFPITSDFYEVKSGHSLTEVSEATLLLLQPGGLIIGFVFSFGL